MPLPSSLTHSKRFRKNPARLYGPKIFLLSFFLTSVLAPAATFGLVMLAYLALGITERGLEALTIIGPVQQGIVFGVAALVGILLGFGARIIGAKTTLPDSGGRLLAPLLTLLLSAPCLLGLDQWIYLSVLDNPFPAARHMLMYREGWGLLLFVWQMLFCLGFVFGAPKVRRNRDASGLSGVDRPPPS